MENLVIKECFKRLLAYGLSDGFIFKHSFIKELNYDDHLLDYLNPWTGLSFNCHIAIKGFKLEFGTTP